VVRVCNRTVLACRFELLAYPRTAFLPVPTRSPTGAANRVVTVGIRAARLARCAHRFCSANRYWSPLMRVIAPAHRDDDMLFTGPELLRLMKIRLNDRMPKSTFYQLIRDGRLLSRGFSREGQPQYTYDDVCAARDKPKPRAKKPAMATMAATNT